MARYRIVPGRSRVWIEARSTLHPIHTETDGLEGWLELELGTGGDVDLAATRPAPTSSCASIGSRRGTRSRTASSGGRIDARRYPMIEGDLTLMQGTSEAGRYRVEGDLTFKGVTRRYEDEMTLEAMDGTMVVLAGERTFDVRDFGLEPPRILLLKVEPDVTVKVAIVAEKES